MKRVSRRSRVVFILLLAAVAAMACSKVVRRVVPPSAVTALDDRSPYLKAHFSDGRLYVLEQWSVDDDARLVTGTGVHYDAQRMVVEAGTFALGVDSVAVFETNVKEMSPAIVPLAFVAGVSIAITIACAANPKACFGSCPTFYVETEDGTEALRAEGFSSSIAPWLEAADVDALRIVRGSGTRVDLRMTNEALETHVVRHADLLACPVGEGERIVRDSAGAFYAARSLMPPTKCIAPEGDITPLVRAPDGGERVSPADSLDLGTRETIDLTFAGVQGGELGLVIGARQSLLTTYLLYETLSNMGTQVGSWLAATTSMKPDPLLLDALGGIDVLVPDGETWRLAGSVGEHGPIATDTWVVPLPACGDDHVTVRLRLTKGNWRLDYIALATLGGSVTPVRVSPHVVVRDGQPDDEALGALWDAAAVVTTLPGDELTLGYTLPGDQPRYELFLESRGYYLEWIRDEWLVDENRGHVSEMLFATDRALVRLAPEYKKVEASMEDTFWRSRYARP